MKPDLDFCSIEFFCVPSLNLAMTVYGISDFVANLKTHNIPLSPNVPEYISDTINIYGILGNDFLTQLSVFEIQSVYDGKMLRVDNGFIPIGCIRSLHLEVREGKVSDVNLPNTRQYNDTGSRFSLLNPEEEAPSVLSRNTDQKTGTSCQKQNKRSKSGDKLFKIPSKFAKAANFVLNPKPTYFSPMNEFFPYSDIDQSLENLFSLESIGIAKEDISCYDKSEIEQFKQSIEFRDNHYHVDIPWNRDLLKQVPSNFELSKILAKKVSLKNDKMDADYYGIFLEQKKLWIIEEIALSSNPHSHVRIPHHPVIRTDELVQSTKIRPVFNCSLKIGQAPSLNEAAYPGTDMLNDLLGLILYFRTNKCAVIADIAKAFLNVKLRKIEDKNCFSFVVFHDGRYHYYRYLTIIFGFISSPFILNFIINHHAANCFNPTVSNILCDKFYMDNMFYTSNDVVHTKEVCLKVKEHMQSANFTLQEWSSNEEQVLEFLEVGKNQSKCKVLGYVYDSLADSLCIKSPQLNVACDTK